MCAESQVCYCGYEFPDGDFEGPIMIQAYASQLIALHDNLRDLQVEASAWAITQPPEDSETGKRVNQLLLTCVKNCGWLKLRSSLKQLQTISSRVKSGTCDNAEFAALISQLRVRIFEDLEDRVFYCVVDTEKIDRLFKRDKDKPGFLIPKHVDEVFDSGICDRFQDCRDDLMEAAKCYMTSLYTACAFHLMRVVEHGVMEVAVLCRLPDLKPSWGSVLKKVDIYAHRTEFKDLPDYIKPHRELLYDLSSEMHAIQRAWRNRVAHIDNKLIPDKPIDLPIAKNLMATVEDFMRSLAERLPRKGESV